MDLVVQEHEKKRSIEPGENETIQFAGVEVDSQRIERYLHRKKRAKSEGGKGPNSGKSK